MGKTYMRQTSKPMVAFTVLLCCLSVGMAYGASNGQNVKIKGLITTRTGETLVIKTADGGNVTVALTDATKVQQPKGLGLRKKQMSVTVLIPGLKISVNGVGCAAGDGQDHHLRRRRSATSRNHSSRLDTD